MRIARELFSELAQLVGMTTRFSNMMRAVLNSHLARFWLRIIRPSIEPMGPCFARR
jgi:hypothetical protein